MLFLFKLFVFDEIKSNTVKHGKVLCGVMIYISGCLIFIESNIQLLVQTILNALVRASGRASKLGISLYPQE
ncbi:MAG: hypothetical protein LBH04_00890 [Tannerellaceae bacterium]|jgi:hypothetical protein|nr:hypothetical protein [Tannerellaceae bacterium]